MRYIDRANIIGLVTLGALALGAAGAGNAAGQSVADFYKGKSVTLAIGTAVGGTIDLYGRLVAKYLGRHIPGNPDVVVQNVPGVSSLKLANLLPVSEPKDGTFIAALNRLAIFDKIYTENSLATFDPLKLNYLGSPDKIWSVAYVWHTSKVKTAQDLLTTETIVGGSPGGSAQLTPQLLKEFAGFKFKVVNGYASVADVDLAAERGEVDGRASTAPASLLDRNWIKDGKVTLLFWNGLEKNPMRPDLPLALDFIKNPEDKRLMELYYAADEIGYPYVVPQNVPQDRLAALKQAFMDTLDDPKFVADAAIQKLDVHPISSEKMTKVISDSYAVSPAIVKRLQGILAPPKN